MKITLTGSLGNISKPLAEKLINAGHEVTVISSNKDKVAAIEALSAKAAIGSITDAAFVTEAFKGADAVYTMSPTDFSAADVKGYIENIGKVYAEAIKAAGVTKVVNLSSIGAEFPEGTGPITGIHRVEETLNKLENVAVKHLRAAYFYFNFYANIDMIKHAGILGSNYSADDLLVMVHPNDIAEAAAEELQGDFTGKSVRYVVGDEYTAGEATAILGAAIGKPELPWVQFSDEDALNGMLQAGMPQDISKNYVEMGASMRGGKLYEDYFKHKPATFGKIKFEEFAKEFAEKYKG